MIHLQDLLAATGGHVHGAIYAERFEGFAYDSRIARLGELFLAVKTARADGHDYIAHACRQGATGVLCERPVDLSEQCVTCVLVSDVREALTDWARYILRKYGPEVVCITGSTGKTTTKEAVAAMLGARYAVFKNYGSFNDRYGLPIALGALLPSHQVAVLEIACDHYDEIRELAAITGPRVGIVTAVSAAHTETLGSVENIALEKGRLVEALPPDGWAVLNGDDPLVRDMAQRTRAQVIHYGLGPGERDRDTNITRLWADGIAVSGEGTAFDLHISISDAARAPMGGRSGTSLASSRIQLSLLGRHNVYAALAALAVALVRGVMPGGGGLAALSALRPLPGRLNPLPGEGGSLLLDDTYNASPAAVLAGLETLREIPAGRRIAVLGDMLELGNYEAEGHRQVGRAAAGIADLLVTRGERARLIAEAAQEAGLHAERIAVTYAAQDAIRSLKGTLRPGDVVLLKGSAETRMEEVTAALLAEPEQSRGMLPRQGPAWEQVRLVNPGRPTWVEIDLEAIANNVRRVAEIVGPEVSIMGVLKADAYGHGAVKVARTALNNGARLMGVACLGEALTLRQAGIAAPILVLGYTPPWQAREMVLHEVTATLFSLDVARALSRAAVELHGVARAHIKVDTGMGRLGLLPEQAAEFIRQVRELPGLEIEGLFTHFSAADELDRGYTLAQLAAFREVLRAVEGLVPLRWVHAANSAALLTLPETRFSLVRLGIAMYGLDPSPEVGCPLGFRPALSFKTTVAQVKELPAGSYISYGRTYRTDHPARIAVIPVGYADGFRRGPAHWGEVLVRGRRAPLVGRVCMDQTMIDVTEIRDAREGDEVVLIGRQGADRITAEDVARRLGTVNYEVISEILARVPRVS